MRSLKLEVKGVTLGFEYVELANISGLKLSTLEKPQLC